MRGTEIFLTVVWLGLAIPTAIEYLRRGRRRQRGVEEKVGYSTGCFYLCVPAVFLGAVFIAWSIIESRSFERPERLLEHYLGISNPAGVQNLKGEFVDMTFDHAAYLYFAASEATVRKVIRDRGFESDPRHTIRERDIADFNDAPPLPSSSEAVIYRRTDPDRGNLETLVTDVAHRRVWLVSVNY